MNFYKFLPVILLVTITSSVFSQSVSSKEVTLNIDLKSNCKLRYYYYPNLQAYFDNLKNVFYYQDKGFWQTAATLPTNYGGYSLYKMNHVEISDFDDEHPYQHLNTHKKQYPSNFKGSKI
ncbi:hypothetical protein [Flavobacterium sp.]